MMKSVTYRTTMRVIAIVLIATFLFSQSGDYAAPQGNAQNLRQGQVGDDKASATGARLKSEIIAGAASAGGATVLTGAAKASAQALGIPRQLRPVNPPANRVVAKMAILDWDGTFSLIRAGWEGLMSAWIAAIINGQWLDKKDVADIVNSVVDINMLPTNLHHDKAGYHSTPAIRRLLNRGKLKLEDLQWTYQMIEKNKGYATSRQFFEAVGRAKTKRAGYKNWLKHFIEWLKYQNLLYQCARRYSIEKPTIKNENAMLEYEARLLMAHYLDAMLETLRQRRLALLEKGKAKPADYLVEDGFDFLRGLSEVGVTCYIVTGSEARTVKEEVEKLGLTNVIPLDNVRGCDRNDKAIAKKEKDVLINEIIEEAHNSGFITDNKQIWGFGDGRVENQVLIDKGCVMVALCSLDNERFFKDVIEALGPAYVLRGTYKPKDELVDFIMCKGKYPVVSEMASVAAGYAEISDLYPILQGADLELVEAAKVILLDADVRSLLPLVRVSNRGMEIDIIFHDPNPALLHPLYRPTQFTLSKKTDKDEQGASRVVFNLTFMADRYEGGPGLVSTFTTTEAFVRGTRDILWSESHQMYWCVWINSVRSLKSDIAEISGAMKELKARFNKTNTYAIVIGGEEARRESVVNVLRNRVFDGAIGVATEGEIENAKSQLNANDEEDFILLINLDKDENYLSCNLPGIDPMPLNPRNLDAFVNIKEYIEYTCNI